MALTQKRTIQELFRKYHIKPSRKLGQNFLIDKRILRKIAQCAQLQKNDIVLEIGPGIGNLTQVLAERARQVIAIEKDPKMVEILKETRHDVMALVKALTKACGESGKYVHLTATSYDIVDTAQALQIKEAIEILFKKGKELLKNCLNISEKYKGLVMIGRTHGQHAIPITLGFKFANYTDKVGENLKRLKEDQKYICGKFSGAVGNYAAQQIYDLGSELEQKIMEKLSIEAADISTQVVARENVARIICDLCVFACTIEQIAKEIRNLQRTEISELSEPFGEKQVGSSTMAQKRNPWESENICSNVRVIRSCVYPILENIALEHERDLTNSASERSILPTAFVLMDDVLMRANKIISGLVVFPENIKKNLELAKGATMAEAVITELVKKGMARQDAHEILRKSSIQSSSENSTLKEILLQNKEVLKYLNADEFKKIMDYNNYIGLSVEKTEKIIQKWKDFSSMEPMNYPAQKGGVSLRASSFGGNPPRPLGRGILAAEIRIHEGSAKNVLILKEPTENLPGQGAFEFLDYFSIFDWGRFLKDPIKEKGVAMAAISRKHFELLEEAGIKTHYEGMAAPTKINISLVNVPESYKNVTPGLKNYLLPIEIIFRIYTHPESSDLKKNKRRKKNLPGAGLRGNARAK